MGKVPRMAGAAIAGLTPSIAWANVGVPMLFVTMPAMLLGLVPIIALEAYVIGKQLGLPFRRVLGPSAIANGVSTLIGIPLTWVALAAIQILTGGATGFGIGTPLSNLLAVTWQAPWLMPYESEMAWMIPVAMLVLMVPFFLVSWMIESIIVVKMKIDLEHAGIRRAVLRANTLSYALLSLYPLGMLILR